MRKEKEAWKKPLFFLGERMLGMSEITILVVDDEERPRINIKRYLELTNRRWEIITAESEKEAKEMIDQNDFNVIVTNIRMETYESGINVLEHAKKNVNRLTLSY